MRRDAHVCDVMPPLTVVGGGGACSRAAGRGFERFLGHVGEWFTEEMGEQFTGVKFWGA